MEKSNPVGYKNHGPIIDDFSYFKLCLDILCYKAGCNQDDFHKAPNH